MKRVVFYFDGFNFYNGLKDKSIKLGEWKNYYWLDFVKFCNEFIDQGSSLAGIKYFTAPPSNNDKRSRQSALFSANKLLNGDLFQVVSGHYQNKTIECRAGCKKKFQSPEEKTTDVSIAIHMLMDCYKDTADTLILVTADSDQVPTVKTIRAEFPNKKVKVYFPPERSSAELLALCKPVVYLGDNEDKFKNSVMPAIVSKDTKKYTRPDKWKVK